MKKALYIVLVLLLAVSLTLATNAQKKTYKIGVLIWHKTLHDEAAFSGFQKGLELSGLPVELDTKRPDGDMTLTREYFTKWRNEKIDLICIIGTSAVLIALEDIKLENLKNTNNFYAFDFLLFGLSYLHLDKQAKTERLFQEICKLHPEEFGYLYGLGKIHFKRQQYHKAKVYLKEYLEKYTEKEYSSYSKYIDIKEVENILEEIEKMKEEVEVNEAA